MDQPQCGDLLDGRYRLDEVLGRGGSAVVFRALDQTTGRIVAVKLVQPDTARGYSPEALRRFDREVRTIAGLRNRHTVTLFATGHSESGFRFMVFEYIDGVDLAAFLGKRGRLTSGQTMQIMEQVLSSLQEAHAKGLLHRDIKPENIFMITSPEAAIDVKLLDFGIARSMAPHAPITRTGELVGTPRYMAPEALLDQPLTSAADIYSVGIVALEMLFGRDALHGSQWGEQIDRLLTGHVFAFPEIERVPPALRRVIDRMVARDAADRYSSATAVLAELQAIRDDAVEPRRVPQATELSRNDTAPRHRVWAVAAGVVVLAWALATLLPRVVAPPPDPAPAPARRPSPLAAPTPAPVVSATPDLGDIEDSAPTATTGCGVPAQELGTVPRRITRSGGIRSDRWLLHVPKKYDENVPHPVVMLFHHDDSSSDELLAQTKFAELAEAEGFLVVGFDARQSRAWRTPFEVDVAHTVLEQIRAELCVDESRVFLVGHGTGSIAVEMLSCAPWVTALATSSYLPRVARFGCEPATARPAIHIAPDQTGHVRLDGAPTCGLTPSPTVSLADFDAMWRERNACESKPATSRHRDGVCLRYSCETPYVSCEIRGGHGWPGTSRRGSLLDPFRCDGTPKNFPSTAVIWDFFANVPRLPDDDIQ